MINVIFGQRLRKDKKLCHDSNDTVDMAWEQIKW